MIVDNKIIPDPIELRFDQKKSFVRSLCPRCGIYHYVYMLWTGRGVPRKFCPSCKTMVALYDDAALYEVGSRDAIRLRRKGNQFEDD